MIPTLTSSIFVFIVVSFFSVFFFILFLLHETRPSGEKFHNYRKKVATILLACLNPPIHYHFFVPSRLRGNFLPYRVPPVPENRLAHGHVILEFRPLRHRVS